MPGTENDTYALVYKITPIKEKQQPDGATDSSDFIGAVTQQPQPQPFPQHQPQPRQGQHRPPQHAKATTPRRLRNQRKVALQRSVSSGGSSAGRSGLKRQLSVINAISFAVFFANVIAAVLVLVTHAQPLTKATRKSFNNEDQNSVNQDWITLGIDKNRDCGSDQCILQVAKETKLSPLACIDWASKTGNCEKDMPAFIVRQSNVEISSAGFYRIYMMIAATNMNMTANFLIQVNDKPWIQCTTDPTKDAVNHKTYARCLLNSVRYMKAGDHVAFTCGKSACNINSFKRLTHFGLEKLQ